MLSCPAGVAAAAGAAAAGCMVLLRRAAAAPVSEADVVTITGSAPAVKLPRNSRDLHAFAPDCPALAIGIAWKIKAPSRVDAAAAAGVAAAMAAAAAAAAAAAGIATTLAELLLMPHL